MNKNYKYILGVILFTTLFGGVFLFGQKAQAVNLKGVVNKLTGNIPSEEYFKGTNEYIDPSQFPKYTQNYNEIFFGSEGISVEELEELSQVVDLTTNQAETPQVVMSVGDEESVAVELSKDKQVLKQKFEEKKSELKKNKTSLKNEKSFETSKVLSVSFNSDPNDEKVAELNFYRGKDENREGLEKGLAELRDKVKTEQDATLKSKLEENLAKGEQMLKEKEEILAKNQSKWELKKSEKSAIINKYIPKIQYAYSAPNKELMDILYPSKEAIDKLNAEIEKERRQVWRYEQSQKGLKEVVKEELSKLSPISQVFAWGDLSNNVNNLLVYSRANQDMVWDVDNANASNGQTFKLWGRSNHAAQQWKFVDSSSQIKFAGAGNMTKCVDVWLQNGSYDNGDIVSLYDCDANKNNQKFVVFADGTIRPKYAQHMCLDASAGVNYGSVIHLWQCHGGSNQQFNAGEYDWGERYYMNFYATQLRWSPIDPRLNGHNFIAFSRSGRGTSNTFSSWPGSDTNYTLDKGRTNNIYTGNSIFVDHNKDWDAAIYPSGKKLKSNSIELTKQKYDEVKFMKGYSNGKFSDTQNNVVYDMSKYESYNVCFSNCSSYSVALWNYIVRDSNAIIGGIQNPYNSLTGGVLGLCNYPGAVYNVLPYYIL